MALDPSTVDVDVAHFERLVADGSPTGLAQATELYQGDLLAGLGLTERPFEEWLTSERERLHELAIQALGRLLVHQRQAGAVEPAVQTGLRLLGLDPLQEPVHRAVMRLYVQLGRREAALRQYQRCVDTLKQELHAEAEAETTQLYEQILRLRPVHAERADRADRGHHSAPNLGPPAATAPAEVLPPTNLPALTSELIGRATALAEVTELLGTHQFVTLIGAGGIGKTRLALDAARRQLRRHADGVWVAELGSLSDPRLVPVTVGVVLGLTPPVGAESPEQVASALSDRRLLLVLDTCEHLIEAAARMAEALLRACPYLRVLATSREPLRAPGEYVYRVLPLQVPVEGTEDHADVLGTAAVQLFVARAKAADRRFPLDARSAAIMAAICRRLDGIPLAIELAAARTATLGLDDLAARLDDRFRLLTGGHRTALPRHRTLRAALDWSYDLLPANERTVLHRLAIFRGSFTLEAACAVAAAADLDAPDIVDSVTNLVAKSLVVLDVTDTATRYRLLDTMRAYAFERLSDSGELAQVARHHAEYYRDFFGRSEAEWDRTSTKEWVATYGGQIDNLRAALDWAFSPSGDAAIGVALTAAAVPIWMQLSFAEEWRSCVDRALASLPAGGDHAARERMQLLVALGLALLLTKGPCPEMSIAWQRALELAESAADAEYQRRALYVGFVDRFTNGENHVALDIARRLFRPVVSRENVDAPEVGDPSMGTSHAEAGRLVGVALHALGDQTGARPYLEAALEHYLARPYRSDTIRTLWDQRTVARCFLARVLWLQGFPDEALRTSQSALEEAQALEHENSVFYTLIQAACPVTIWAGDLAAAERPVRALGHFALKHGRATWKAWHECFLGMLLLRQGDHAEAAHILQGALTAYNPLFFHMHHTRFLAGLAEALGGEGNTADGLRTIDHALERAQEREELWCVPELLRTKGELLASQPSSVPAGEAQFTQALDMAERQGALAWELRTATSLARLWSRQGKTSQARELLEPIYRRFTEGFDTPDLKSARALLDGF